MNWGPILKRWPGRGESGDLVLRGKGMGLSSQPMTVKEVDWLPGVGGTFLPFGTYGATAGASTGASTGSAVTTAVASTAVAVAASTGVLSILVTFTTEICFVMTNAIKPREKSGTRDFAGVGCRG
jgi:hypothetical protein